MMPDFIYLTALLLGTFFGAKVLSIVLQSGLLLALAHKNIEYLKR